jgi:alpha-N-acetylglucosaminidase
MLVASGGKANSAILLGRSPSWLEEHAASELAKYLAMISGTEIPIARTPPSGVGVLAIGRPETNEITELARGKGLTGLSRENPGGDGFVIESIVLEGREVLLVGGSSDRGTLYAVYALLENVLGVGFFRDGELVPKQDTIDLVDLHISDSPRFQYREDGSGCIFAYSTPYWDMDDWKRELDWRAKKRVNMIWPFRIGGNIVGEILHDWGVLDQAPPGRREPTLDEEVHEYARKLGMRIPVILPNGSLPDAFYDKRRDARTLVTQYSEYPPTRQLHPLDPDLRRLVVDFIRRYTERYGTDHLYIAEFVSESVILEGADDIQQVRGDFARAISHALSEADPEGIWLPSSWSWDMFHDPPEGWTPEDVRAYLDAITAPVLVWDIWSEEAAKYEVTQHFFGRPWGFGVLHSFGGNSYLHGDVPGLIDRVRNLLRNPKADSCILFSSGPEIIGYNEFYLEAAARLSWNPLEVTLGGFVEDYCRHRYGETWASKIEPAWWELVASVYGPDSGSIVILMDPLYWLRPNLSLLHGAEKVQDRAAQLWQLREAYVPRLRRAMEIFLQSPDLLEGNVMARKDLVDIARQWIAERFNIEIRRARDAFLSGETEEFETAAEASLTILDQQIRLLSSWKPYRLDNKIIEATPRHGDDAARAVKHFHLWVTYNADLESEPLRDYYRMDLDGLVAGLYRPRVEAFLGSLRKEMARGKKEVDEGKLEVRYSEIESEFISAPLPSLWAGEDPVSIVSDLLELTK